jgi:hypothetical protein
MTRLLTVAETAEALRGTADAPACDFVRGLILDGRLSAIKQRGRWYIQQASIDDLTTPRVAPTPAANPPRRLLPKGARTA